MALHATEIYFLAKNHDFFVNFNENVGKTD